MWAYASGCVFLMFCLAALIRFSAAEGVLPQCRYIILPYNWSDVWSEGDFCRTLAIDDLCLCVFVGCLVLGLFFALRFV